MLRDYITEVPWAEVALFVVILAAIVVAWDRWIGRRGGRAH